MKPVPITALAVAAALAAGGARAAGFQDCPFAGPMPDYAATAKPQWENWDTRKYIVTKDGNDVEITPEGAVCTQTYDEKPGKTDGSALEIGENYKESWEQMGAEIGRSLFRRVPTDELDPAVEGLVAGWVAARAPGESFASFARRSSDDELGALAGLEPARARQREEAE